MDRLRSSSEREGSTVVQSAIRRVQSAVHTHMLGRILVMLLFLHRAIITGLREAQVIVANPTGVCGVWGVQIATGALSSIKVGHIHHIRSQALLKCNTYNHE